MSARTINALAFTLGMIFVSLYADITVACEDGQSCRGLQPSNLSVSQADDRGGSKRLPVGPPDIGQKPSPIVDHIGKSTKNEQICKSVCDQTSCVPSRPGVYDDCHCVRWHEECKVIQY